MQQKNLDEEQNKFLEELQLVNDHFINVVEETNMKNSQQANHMISPKRNKKGSKKRRNIGTPPLTPCSDCSDDSSQNSSKNTSSPRKRNTRRHKKKKVRCQLHNNMMNDSSKQLEAMQEEIIRLQSIQDQMEKYQASLEKEHRSFQRQIHAMEFSHEMIEKRNRELETKLEEVTEENEWLESLCHRRDIRTESSSTEQDEKMELLQVENQILRDKLERCELAVLRSTTNTKRHSNVL